MSREYFYDALERVVTVNTHTNSRTFTESYTYVSNGYNTTYAVGSDFEKWFYRAYNIVKQCQQVSHKGYRFDAIFKNSIVELKNYNWNNYSSYNSLIRSFTIKRETICNS